MTPFFFPPYFIPLSQKENKKKNKENTHILNSPNHPTYTSLNVIYLQGPSVT